MDMHMLRVGAHVHGVPAQAECTQGIEARPARPDKALWRPTLCSAHCYTPYTKSRVILSPRQGHI